jgi:hypothetical protein|tara:strand:+ start:228 stop:488 length:261 start_codon:yes stop_codon:yes gene_type:complete
MIFNTIIIFHSVVGNLFVEEDPVFGGGHLKVVGNSSKNEGRFKLTMDDEAFALLSASDIDLLAGDGVYVNAPGGGIQVNYFSHCII